MKTVSAEQMRELDRRTIEDYGIPGKTLMERAGRGVAEKIAAIIEYSPTTPPAVRLIAGGGNNGGDAFVAARYLREFGCRVDVFGACRLDQIKGDAREQLDALKQTDIATLECADEEAWKDIDPNFRGVVVDGLLGTGSRGAPRGTVGAAVDYINRAGENALVASIDIPTGIDADSGEAEGQAVRADLTITMALPKTGLLLPSAIEYVGQIEVVDIGIPAEIIPAEGDLEFISASDVAGHLNPRRPRAAHKGEFGRVLVVGGAPGYSGSVAMAARAALRSGAGLVTAYVPHSIAAVVAGYSPEVMVNTGPQTDTGSLSHNAWDELERRLDDFDALLLGPGLTRCDDSLRLVRDIIRDCPTPIVVDADAVAVLEGSAHWFDKSVAPVVITPHPGEMATLLMKSVEEVQSDRWATARNVVQDSGATVVLKGAATCIANPEDDRVWVNMTGTPGMATAGSGDVLAGMIAAFIAQGIDPRKAPLTAVYLHGRAGSRAAALKSEAGMIAGDIIESIPAALREVVPR